MITDLLSEFLKKTKHVKPIQSSKEVNSQFAIFDESETQYIKNSMKFVTFPFILDQKLDQEQGKSSMVAYLFSPCLPQTSPIQLKDLGWDRKELKSAKILTAFPKNFETIVEEPTLEIQETDYDTLGKESADSATNLRSVNDFDDNSKASSSRKRAGPGSTRSFPSVRDATLETQNDDESHLKLKKSLILVEVNQSEELPPPPFNDTQPNESVLKTNSIEMTDSQIRGTRSERAINSYSKLIQCDQNKDSKPSENSNFQNTLNQLRSLRQKYSKSPNKDIGRSISPKTLETVKKQLQNALKSRAYQKFEDEETHELARSSISAIHESIDTKIQQKKVYKSSSMNVRRSPMILPMAVSAEFPTPEFKVSPKREALDSYRSKKAKGDAENTQKTGITETEAFSFGHRISCTTVIETFNVDNQKLGEDVTPIKGKIAASITNSHQPNTHVQQELKHPRDSVKISEPILTQAETKEDSISVSTLQRIFSNANYTQQPQSQSLREAKSGLGLFKKISQKKTDPLIGGLEQQDQTQDSSLLLSQMLDKVAKSRSSVLRKRTDDNIGSTAESPQNIRMVFNNLFVDGIANISLGDVETLKKHTGGDPGSQTTDLVKKETDSCKPSQRKLIADLVRQDRQEIKKAKGKHKKGNSQHIESSKSSADKSIRSAAQNSTDNHKPSYVKSRKKTIGTTADLINITKGSQMIRTGGPSSGNSILNKSEKALKINQGHLDLSSDQNLQKYHVPVKNSKFSSQMYPGGSHPKTVLLEDTDKSCAAIRQKVKDLLDPKHKGFNETPTNGTKRASLGTNFPVTSHKITKANLGKVPTAQ